MVERASQGSGLGRQLLEERVRLALADPAVRRVRLSTSQRTRAFFEKLGFYAVELIPDGIGPGLDRVEMIMHRRPA
jgi:predicted GNAT family N-acyltransferase